MAILEHTDEWYTARRTGITSTDLPAILGLSKYASEGDVAREKLTGSRPDDDAASERRKRLGTALQDVIAAEEVVEHGIPLRRVKRLIVSKTIPWAMTSLDFERVGERCIVEVKSSASARDFRDGLPERVEAQVRWQMGVRGYPRAHVAALRFGRELACFDVEHDDAVFANLVFIAEDFRRRLAAGGPFDESRESARRAWPYDDGSTMIADDETVAAVLELINVRSYIGRYEEREEKLVAAISTRMGPASELRGVPGVRVTWRRAKDSTQTEWKLIAEGLLKTLPEAQREALVSIQTHVKEGSRRLIVRETGDEK